MLKLNSLEPSMIHQAQHNSDTVKLLTFYRIMTAVRSYLLFHANTQNASLRCMPVPLNCPSAYVNDRKINDVRRHLGSKLGRQLDHLRDAVSVTVTLS